MASGCEAAFITRALFGPKAHLHPPFSQPLNDPHAGVSVYLSEDIRQCRVLALSPCSTIYELCDLRQVYQPFQSPLSRYIHLWLFLPCLQHSGSVVVEATIPYKLIPHSFVEVSGSQTWLYIGIPRSTLQLSDAWSHSRDSDVIGLDARWYLHIWGFVNLPRCV